LRTSWEKGLHEVGKDPTEQPVVVEHWAMVGDAEEAREAAGKWRLAPKAWKSGYFDDVSPVDIQARAEKEIPLESPPRLDDQQRPQGPQERDTGARQLCATHVFVHVAATDQLKVIGYFGREVLSGMRKSS